MITTQVAKVVSNKIENSVYNARSFVLNCKQVKPQPHMHSCLCKIPNCCNLNWIYSEPQLWASLRIPHIGNLTGRP